MISLIIKKNYIQSGDKLELRENNHLKFVSRNERDSNIGLI
jgi:hypothetical protein